MHLRRLRPHLLGMLIAVTCACHAWAQTPPPNAPFDTATPPATLAHAPFAGLRMGRMRVDFEHTTLAEVRNAAGTGRVAQRGDAGAGSHWLCYTSQGRAGAQRIWIESGSEMGGPEGRITGISADLLQQGQASADCPHLPATLAPLALDTGLWLGATPDDVAGRIGEPSLRQGDWSSYDYQGKTPGQCQGGADLTISLRLHFKNGHADALRAHRVTSC